MTAKRRKPLLVNVMWVCVLAAPAVYFASWLGLHWLYGRGVLDLDTAVTTEKRLYYPLRWYAYSGLPGGDPLLRLADRCIVYGTDSQE